jgi:hypothetical protein
MTNHVHLLMTHQQRWISSERACPLSLSMPLSDRIWSGILAGVKKWGTLIG